MWQASPPPVSSFPCLPRQLGSGTKLIWRRDKSRWLALHDSQVMINEHTLHAHTTAHSQTWVLVSCIRCVYVIYSSECVYRIIDIFISPPFRHKANLLIRAICSTCPQLVRPLPPLSLTPPSLFLHSLLPLFTSCGFSTWHKFCGVNYEALLDANGQLGNSCFAFPFLHLLVDSKFDYNLAFVIFMFLCFARQFAIAACFAFHFTFLPLLITLCGAL